MATTTPQEAVTRVEQQLQHGKRSVTLTDAAAITGLSIDEARDALDALLTKYVCRLQVSENGDLIYRSGGVLCHFFGAADCGACGFERPTIFTAWASSEYRCRPGHAGPPVCQYFPLAHHSGTIDHTRDRYRHYQPQPAVLNTHKKSFIASVYDFVFGPPRVQRDLLTNQQEVAAYLRQQKGLMVAAELIALAGWAFPQAEAFLTDCILRYRGEGKVSENAVLYREFDEIMRSAGTVEAGEIVYYWDEYEPDYELTGNSSTHNLVIMLMNSFNLLISILVVYGSFAWLLDARQAHALLASLAAYAPLLQVLLGWMPMVFSTLFFVIPLIRFTRVQVMRRRPHYQNIRKRLFKVIFATQG